VRAVVFFLFFLLSGVAYSLDRVVSLSPALTEMVIFVGAPEKLKGVTVFSSAPKELERVGGIVNPSLEKILSLRPDAVIATNLTPRALLEKLSSYGIKVYVFRLVSLSDVEKAIEEIGNLLGRDGKEKKEEFLRLLKERTERLKSCLGGKTLAFLISFRPLYVAGKRSYLGEILEMAGAKVVPDVSFGALSPEFFLAKRPSLVILALRNPKGAESFLSRFGIRSLEVDPNLFLHPSPKVLEGLSVLERKLCEK